MRASPIGFFLAVGAVAFCSAAIGGEARSNRDSVACPSAALSAGYVERVARALNSPEDVWGNKLLAKPGGPTYAGALGYMKPLLFARGPKGTKLTASGVHYVAFSGPVGAEGAGSMALHVADGSQILSQRASGRSLTFAVGKNGNERYGSCLARLSTPRLANGYLPILQTRYVDANGVRYRQESFATHIPQTRSLVSLVELAADARHAAAGARMRLTSSESGLTAEKGALVRGANAYLAFNEGGEPDGSSVVFDVPRGSSRTVYAASFNSPRPSDPLQLDRETHESARASLARYWVHRLAEGMTILAPERDVLDAERNLLIQNLGLTWRYSVGNPYQQFSFPEGIDVAQVMSDYGHRELAQAMLLRSLAIPLTRYPNWKMGQKLVGSALYYRLFRNTSYVDRVTLALGRYVRALGRQIRSSRRGMLQRERFSSDIPDSVYGLHSQAVVWQGLRAMAAVWAATGHRALGAEAEALARRLGAGLRQAVPASAHELPDGSLFVPARLLDPERPYERVTESRAGGYWNLVAPYAFASGLFPPGGPEARGVLRYLLLHGSRLLGLVRAGVYSLYGLAPVQPTSGVNPVYGLNVARFLADNHRSDQLVLSLYGQLAAGMTPGTFVSGEGLSVTPLSGEYYRSMYLPPNGASNGSFLETLRLLLVHETRDPGGTPHGLELAFATPRAWLEPGKAIVVRGAPTSFGFVSFSIARRVDSVAVTVDVPSRAPVQSLRLRLRLPAGEGISSVTVDKRTYRRFDVRSSTIDLSGSSGRLDLVVHVGR